MNVIASHSDVAMWTINTLTDRSNEQQLSLARERQLTAYNILALQDMELEDAVHTALLTLKEGFEGQISGNNIEVAIVGEDQKFRVLTPAEVSDYLEEVE